MHVHISQDGKKEVTRAPSREWTKFEIHRKILLIQAIMEKSPFT